jgi:tetratricopeptide (TPR) repeat protein
MGEKKSSKKGDSRSPKPFHLKDGKPKLEPKASITQSGSIDAPNWFSGFWIQALVVFLLGVGVYVKSWQNEYAVDDSFTIVENVYTQAGFSGISHLLFKDSMAGWQQEGSKSAVNYYRPLALVTFAIEKGIQGKNNPQVSHIINSLLYGLLLIVLLSFLWLALRQKNPFVTLGTVLLFAVHPIHTEVVSNIKSRDEILSFLFGALTLMSLLRANDKADKFSIWQILTAFFYFLALLAKENSVTLLGIAPLALYIFRKQPLQRAITLCWPLFVVFLGYLLLRIGIIGFNLKLSKPDPISNRFFEVDFGQKYATIFYILLFYIRILFLPHPLSWDYSFKEISLHSFTEPLPLISLFLHFALLGYALIALKERKLISFAIGFYFISLSLVSNLVIDIGGFVGERFLFQPSFGFCLIGGIGLHWLSQKLIDTKLRNLTYVLPASLALAYLFIGSYKTILRSLEWKNNETLFIRDAEASPKSAQANMACGSSCLTRAKQETTPEAKKIWLEKAIHHSKLALNIFPYYAEPIYNIGMAYTLLGDTQAFSYWRRLIQLAPNYPPVQFIPKHESSLYLMLGNQNWQNKNVATAQEYYRIAVEKAPENYAAWYHLGLCYEVEKNYEQALTCMEKAVALNPKESAFWYALGIMAINANQKDKARAAWEKTLTLAPQNEAAKKNLELLR